MLEFYEQYIMLASPLETLIGFQTFPWYATAFIPTAQKMRFTFNN